MVQKEVAAAGLRARYLKYVVNSLKILLGPPLTLEPFEDLTSVEKVRIWLEETLNELDPK